MFNFLKRKSSDTKISKKNKKRKRMVRMKFKCIAKVETSIKEGYTITLGAIDNQDNEMWKDKDSINGTMRLSGLTQAEADKYEVYKVYFIDVALSDVDSEPIEPPKGDEASEPATNPENQSGNEPSSQDS